MERAKRVRAASIRRNGLLLFMPLEFKEINRFNISGSLMLTDK
jgi:hypothetical protein